MKKSVLRSIAREQLLDEIRSAAAHQNVLFVVDGEIVDADTALTVAAQRDRWDVHRLSPRYLKVSADGIEIRVIGRRQRDEQLQLAI